MATELRDRAELSPADAPPAAALPRRGWRLPWPIRLPDTVTSSRAFREVRFLVGLGAVFHIGVMTTLTVAALVAVPIPGWGSVVVTSDSMTPAVRSGDVVLVSDYDGAPVIPGRVIVFEDASGEGLITHRVIAVAGEDSYLTKGDANLDADSTPVQAHQIRGIGRVLIPLVGLPVVWVTSGAWMSLGIAVAATALSLSLLRFGLLDEYVPWS